MKIAFLAGYNSIHTVRWVNEMAVRGHEVHLFTMHPGTEKLNQNIIVHYLPLGPPYGYYLNAKILRKRLNEIEPDLLNTHYASGYGTLARLCGFRPNLLSVWGSDVYDFPKKNIISHNIVKKNLESSDQIASTSEVMKIQVESIIIPEKEIAVTPFGIDCDKFKPERVKKQKQTIKIGTVKSMAPKYGIELLINAFYVLQKRVKIKTELILVGGGPQLKELMRLTDTLGINRIVKFIGPVAHEDVPRWLNNFDIYAALSTLDSESFGVAVLEASACGLPVVVSDAGGLPEVVVEGKTGFIVPRNNVELAADKLQYLLEDPNTRAAMGLAGRKHVMEKYNWNVNAARMEKLYCDIVNNCCLGKK